MPIDTDTAPGGRPGRLRDDLNREWRQLLVEHEGQVVAWAARHPGLAGCEDLQSVASRASRGCDATYHALLIEAHRGDQLAARTVLQGMLGRMITMARRDRQAALDDYVAALWCVIARYPLAARPVRIPANLALDTLKLVRRDLQWWSRPAAVVWLAGRELEPVLDQWFQRAEVDHAPAAGLGAAAVIEAGRRLELLDEATSGLLRQVYVEGLTSAEVAARQASTSGSVRVRCSRAVSRLAAHAALLADAA